MKQRFKGPGDSDAESLHRWIPAPYVEVTVRSHGSQAMVVSVSPGATVRDALEAAGFQVHSNWEVWLNGSLANLTTPIPLQGGAEILYSARVEAAPVDPRRLIEFIVWYATKMRGQVSRIRLIKFIYLSDWLSVRHTGRRLTKYPWFFYHYGPYASPVQEEIDAAVGANAITVEEISSAEERDIFLYRKPGDDPEFWRDVSVDLEARLRRLVDRWIQRPLNEFLDFVYFETEPMLKARRGEVLDFTTIQQEPPPSRPPARVSRQPSTVAQNALRRFLARVREARPLDPPPVYDDLYRRALSFLDEQDLPRTPLRGDVEIGPDAGLRTSE